MSTRVVAKARLIAACRHALREQLGLNVDPDSELSRLNSIIGSRQLTLSDLQHLISTPSTSSMLSTLAPADFSRVRARLEGGSRSALETTAADLQTELADTLAIAATVVATATRGITVNTFAECGLELGYTVTTRESDSATCVELRRGLEIVIVGVHDDGTVEFDHGGLTNSTRRDDQLQLERAVERRGILFAQSLQLPGEPGDPGLVT
jgi:hypothetical protein